ncbi:hypothetical protein [Dactylosporangium sp. CA-233914]|uniref:hypothetical protein n=1 Tax=Dactylosporangium sp. CA-233914 TaxID=3239934 RepID=UPI003D90235C
MYANVMDGERLDLADEEVAHYRKMLSAHANQGAAGRCGICRQRGCRDWTAAFDTLAAAHALMGTEEDWDRRELYGAVK